MDYLFKYEVNRRLSGKPHLRPVFDDTHNIAERIRDVDPTFIENGLWVNLMFHSITDAPGQNDCRIADFQAIIDYLDTKKEEIKVVTCLEALYRS